MSNRDNSIKAIKFLQANGAINMLFFYPLEQLLAPSGIVCGFYCIN